MTTITIFNEKIVIFAYQLQNFLEKKNFNFKLILIKTRQAIKRVISIHSRSTKLNRDIDDVIDRIKFIEFIESKHVSRWVVNHSRFRHDVRVFVYIVKTTLKKFFSFIDTTTNNLTLTRFLIETKTKTFTRRFNNTSRITIEKNIYNQSFEFYFDNDENIITNQLNVQIQRIVNVVIDNYIVKHLSQFDSSNSSKFLNSSNFQNIVENDDNDTSIWRSKNLDFFDSHLSSFYESKFIIRDDKNVYYRNVYLFVEKILNLIVVRYHAKIKKWVILLLITRELLNKEKK